MLKANGKFIDTLPIKHLLSLNEAKADTVIIQVDRYHDTHDLYDFVFVMRSVTESGAETQAELTKLLSNDEEHIFLIWNIDSLFTAEAGKLFLDLTAYQYSSQETDVVENPPDYLMRYQLPAVEIRDIPEGTGEASDDESYTAFWTEIRETIRNLERSVGVQGETIRNLSATVSQHQVKIQELEERLPPQE